MAVSPYLMVCSRLFERSETTWNAQTQFLNKAVTSAWVSALL